MSEIEIFWLIVKRRQICAVSVKAVSDYYQTNLANIIIGDAFKRYGIIIDH